MSRVAMTPPVVRDVDQSSINGINHAIAEVAARARANKLRLDAMRVSRSSCRVRSSSRSWTDATSGSSETPSLISYLRFAAEAQAERGCGGTGAR